MPGPSWAPLLMGLSGPGRQWGPLAMVPHSPGSQRPPPKKIIYNSLCVATLLKCEHGTPEEQTLRVAVCLLTPFFLKGGQAKMCQQPAYLPALPDACLPTHSPACRHHQSAHAQ